MSQTVTSGSGFPASFEQPANGDPVNSANIATPFSALATRTQTLKTDMDLISSGTWTKTGGISATGDIIAQDDLQANDDLFVGDRMVIGTTSAPSLEGRHFITGSGLALSCSVEFGGKVEFKALSITDTFMSVSGSWGWQSESTSTTGHTTSNGISKHPGFISMTTNGTSGSNAYKTLRDGAGTFLLSDIEEIEFIFLNGSSNTNVERIVGVGNLAIAPTLGSSSVRLTTLNGSAFTFWTRSGDVEAAGTSTGVTPGTTTWHVVKFVVNADATQIDCYVNGVLVASKTSNIPTSSVSPFFFVQTATAGTKTMSVDECTIRYKNMGQRFT